MVDYQPRSTFPRSVSEAAIGSIRQLPEPIFIEESRSSYAAVHEEARRTASLRIAWWRGEQRRQRQEEQREQPPPWFKARQAAASALRVKLWAKEACEKAAPPRTLITTTATTLSSPSSPGRKPRVTPAAAEEVLQQKLADFSSLLARLKRFALLNEEVHMVGSAGLATASTAGASSSTRTSTMLRETAGLDEARNLFADLLCALRTCMTAVVEAVQACAAEQHGDDFLNLNLPAVRRAFPPPPASEAAPAAAAAPTDGGGGGGFAGFSASRHSRILCSVVEQVAAFIPLPFAHDPLLLKWFDEHAEIWQTMLSMQAVKAAKAVQHGVTDRKRMEAAQQVLCAALKSHGVDQPHILQPDTQWDNFPRHVIGATAAAVAPIPSPVPPPGPLSAGRLSQPGSMPGTAEGLRRFAPSPSAPSLISPGAVVGGGLSRPGTVSGARPGSVGLLSAGGGSVCAPSRLLTSASPSNLAPDTELPPDPRVEAELRAEARARALWNGLELLVYGEPHVYSAALKRMFLRQEEDAKAKKLAAHAVMVVAVGGQLDEETLIRMAVRTLQRSWRKKRQQKLEQLRYKAEHSATIAILGARH